jgi:hypothetical protein
LRDVRGLAGTNGGTRYKMGEGRFSRPIEVEPSKQMHNLSYWRAVHINALEPAPDDLA